MANSGWYMSSTSNIPKRFRGTMGNIEGIPGIRPVALDACSIWCLDNSVYTGRFEERAWLDRIESLKKWYPKCAFVTIPDVIGNAAKTIEQFGYYRDMVKVLPVALVSQDGIRDCSIPWDRLDCIFIGGTDEHKLGSEGAWIIDEAQKRGKWVHVGRVNSAKRILQFWKADSWDGTCLSFGPSHVSRLHSAVLQVRAMKKSRGLFDEN